ncbi:MAG TPA: GFA family protein [Polyangiaceae bacterium]|nr:GFA family protein [Polyangiaceae bacterium]
MPAPFSDGCACGRVRYVCDAEPSVMFNCHCRDCQYATGGAYAPVLMVPAASLRLLGGEPRYFERAFEDGRVMARGFCPDCGTPVFGKRSVAPELIGIRAGTLDDPSWFEPRMELWTASAQPWDLMDPARPKHPTQPSPPGRRV